MIKRLYVHNFRSLINFEVEPAGLTLLMGPNGAGKSALLDVLDRIRRLVSDGERLEGVFPRSELPVEGVSHKDPMLRLELDLDAPGEKERYYYRLAVEYDPERNKQRITYESLKLADTTLFRSEKGEAQLHRDDGSAGPGFPMDWGQSGVGFLMERKDNQKLSRFKDYLRRIWVVRLNPFSMLDETRQEAERPRMDMQNFADWYRHVALAYPDALQAIRDDLQERMPGFKTLRLAQAGEASVLKLDFEDNVAYRFSQLSEGQRALIVLYAVMRGLAARRGATLCIDEPENFLALPEIQPWLDTLEDLTEEESLQVVLISHHPRLLNFLAAGHGWWMTRDDGTGPTRCRKIGPSDSGAPINMDELVERGWVNGG